MAPGNDAKLQDHVRGIDSLRFLAALWVAIAHGAGPPVRELLHGGAVWSRVVAQVYGVVFCAPAAVVVFFVISGLCIHLPFVRAERIQIREYFVRRYVRIGGPLVVVLLTIHLFSNSVTRATLDVVWSVYCEIAYYTLYPLLFWAFRWYGLKLAIAAATAISTLLIVMHWQYLYNWQFGPLTFLTAFPAWLLGCLIAERLTKGELPGGNVSIWYWRAGAWIASVLAMLGVFHSPIRIGYPAALLPFSFYCYFWLQQELRRWRDHPPWRWLESAGLWSYSIYLVHKSVVAAFAETHLPVPALASWAFKSMSVLVLSFVFYLIVERPIHLIARRCGRSLSKLRAAPIHGY